MSLYALNFMVFKRFKSSRSRSLFGLLFVVFVLSSAIPLLSVEKRSLERVHLVVAGDLYELLDGPNRAGIARLAGFIHSIRENVDDPVFVFHTGDAISPSVWGFMDRGVLMIEALNRLRLDAMVPGNHEFDFGWQHFTRISHQARFPFVMTFLPSRHNRPPNIRHHLILEKKGVHLLVLGLNEWGLSSDGNGIRNYDDNRLIPALKDMIQKYGKTVDLIILLSHQSFQKDLHLLRSLEKVDLLLGGDEHHPIVWRIGNRYLVKPGAGNQTVAHLSGRKRPGQPWEWDIQIRSLIDFPEADHEMNEWLLKETAETRQTLAHVITRTRVPLDARREVIRVQSTPWMNWVVDQMRSVLQGDVALLNAGAVRWDRVFPPGPIRLLDLVEAFPFGNTLALVRMNGRQLRVLLESTLIHAGEDNGLLLHVSGLRYAYQPERPIHHRLCSLMDDGGQTIQDDQKYRVVVNDYLYYGAGGQVKMDFEETLIPPEEGPALLEVIRHAIETKGIILKRGDIRVTPDCSKSFNHRE